MIVEVIPVVKLPRSVTAIFSYTAPKNFEAKVEVGQIVEVNFRGRKIQAVIVGIDGENKFKYKLKEFERTIVDQSLVTEEQIDLIFWMSEYYYISPAVLAKSLVPKIPKRIVKMQKAQKCRKHKNAESTKNNIGPFFEIRNKIGVKKQIWFYNFESEKLKKYKREISKNLNNKKQTLIVVPTVYDLEILKDKLVEDGFNEEYIIGVTAQQGVKEEFGKWLEVLSGKPRIIISTKIGIFYPFNNLGSIIVDSSESWDHKQSDINPRCDTRTVALMLGDLCKCKVFFGSVGHRLEEIRNKKLEISTKVQEQSKIGDSRIGLTIIDLKNVYKTKEFALISDPLEDAIKLALEKGEKIFLFLNRKGQGTSTVCQTCGFVFKCEHCQLPLVLHDENRLRCHYCNSWQDMPPFCPKCQGPDIRSFGQGTERVENYLKNVFTGVEILRLDSDKKLEMRNKKLGKLNSQITIGTEYALNKIDWSEIGLVGVLNADAGLVVPDFRASERTYQLLRRIIALFTGLETRQRLVSTQRQIIIQTYHPDSHIIQAVENNKPEIFYDEELKTRKELGYPPFIKLIKLIYRDESKKKAAYMADRLYRDLVKFQKKNKTEGVEILDPVRAYVERVRGKYRYYVILKHKNTESTKTQKAQKQLDDLIKIVPDDWVVDVEPESLL